MAKGWQVLAGRLAGKLAGRLVIGLISFYAITTVAFSAESPPSKMLTITKITDGDSLRAGDIRIRIHGIDAPEMRQICHKAEAYNCGIAARDYLASALGDKAVLRCEHLDTDRYQRLVMRCYHRGIDIGAGMVRAGWALAYRRYAKDYISDEAEARAAQRGLWAGTFQTPEAWRKEN